jgi:alpha-L-fucosidase
VYGEGPSTNPALARGLSGRDRISPAYTSADVRFTTKGDTVYAFVMAWPAHGKAVIKSLAKGAPAFPKNVARVELLGAGQVKYAQDEQGLTVYLPENKPNDFAYALKITPT